EAIRRAAVAVSRGDRIALLGIRPDRPETGFGYIQAEGDSLCSGLLQVRRFLEKPDAGLARELAKRPDTYWNSGIFIVPLAAARRIIQESSAVLGDFMASLPPPGTSRLPGQTGRERLVGAFAGVEPVPFDSAVLEKSRKTVLLPVEAGWSDLGSWEAILESSPRDERGNSISDGSLAVEAEGCLLKAEKGRIVALGVRDLIVISWGESVLVCPRDRAQEVRNLVASLPPEGSPPSTKRGGMK
ncbi:MAG: sugar phosphate nucleotidyltransferase, partial [Acidobacteriota bacterium]